MGRDLKLAFSTLPLRAPTPHSHGWFVVLGTDLLWGSRCSKNSGFQFYSLPSAAQMEKGGDFPQYVQVPLMMKGWRN